MPLFSRLSVVLLVIFALFAVNAPVRAMDLYSYDLDSLVYLSSEVLDANVVSVQTEGGLDITTVRVTRVYLGRFHVGDTVKVTALDFFRVGGQTPGSVVRSAGRRRIEAGDSATFFLAKAKSVFLYDIPKDADIYWPAPSGVKMLDQGRIKGFEQYENPGPYGLEWTDANTLKLLPTPEQFYAQLAESIRHVEPLRTLLTKTATAADEPALLTLLRQRAHTVFPRQSRLRDAIADAACGQIVSLHDLNAVADALAITQNRILSPPLQTPSGRNFLLRVVGISTQPEDRRLGCSKALGAAFAWWDLPANGDYLPRLVMLAAKVQESPELAATVLEQLDDLAWYDTGSPAPTLAYPSIRHGLPALLGMYQASNAGAVRFAVEKLIVDTLGPAAYGELHSPCGPVISLAQPGAAAGKLNYQASIRWVDASWYTATRTESTSLVLVNVKSGKRYVLPSGRWVDGWTDGTNDHWTMQADLPASLPHGRYRVFLEFSRPHQPLSTGYGYEADL